MNTLNFRLSRTVVLCLFVLGSAGALAAQSCPEKCASMSECGELKNGNQKLYANCLTSCEKKCEAPPPPPVTLNPRYLVLGLIYAPPGCSSSPTNQCANATSSVDYSSGSSLGSKVAVKDSFKVGFSAETDFGPGTVVGADAGFTGTQADSYSVNLTKSATLDIKALGNGDGIDHGQDQFILMLNPSVTLSQQNHNIYWRPGYNGPTLDRYEVYVSELRRPSTMRPEVAQQLKALGFTTQDYQNILSLDPYGGKVCEESRLGINVTCSAGTFTDGTSSGPALDSNRFAATSWSFPYEPQLQSQTCNNGVCTCTIFSGTIKNELVNESSHEADAEYTVDLKTNIGVPDVWGFKTDTTLTWTNSNTTTNSTDSTQSATATISCPSPGYTGPTNMAIYWDKMWGTFLFIPYNVSAAVLHQGKVTTVSGAPVAGQIVNLTYGGKTYHTVTGRDGAYKFFVPPGKPATVKTAQLKIGAVSRTVNLASNTVMSVRLH